MTRLDSISFKLSAHEIMNSSFILIVASMAFGLCDLVLTGDPGSGVQPKKTQGLKLARILTTDQYLQVALHHVSNRTNCPLLGVIHVLSLVTVPSLLSVSLRADCNKTGKQSRWGCAARPAVLSFCHSPPLCVSLSVSVHLIDSDMLPGCPRPRRSPQSRRLGVPILSLQQKEHLMNTDTGQRVAILAMLLFSFWHRSPANMAAILHTAIMPEGGTAWTGFWPYYSNLIRRINICQSCGWRHTRWNGACLIHTISA